MVQPGLFCTTGKIIHRKDFCAPISERHPEICYSEDADDNIHAFAPEGTPCIRCINIGGLKFPFTG